MGVTFDLRTSLARGGVPRYLLAIILLFHAGVALAQDTRVQRAAHEVTIEGKRYYMHRVEPGQTLFSIARAYDVTVDEIMTINGKKDHALAPDEILQIPRVEPYRPTDDTYYYHKMKAGETFSSLSRQFGARVRQIARENPRYDDKNPIPVGAIVRLPLSQIDRRALDVELRRLEAERQAALEQEQAREETREIPVDPVYPGMAGVDHVKLSVLLPFGVKENRFPSFDETLAARESGARDERWRISAKSEPFLEFYAGLLIAVDSLKRVGYTIDLQVLDTRKDSTRLDLLAEELNRFAPHVVIGPVHAGEYARVAEQFAYRNVPLVYPLSTRGEGLGRFPNFVQVTGSTPAMLDEMARWTARRGREARVIAIIPPATAPRGEEADLPDRVRRYLPDGEGEMTVFHWDGATLPPLKELAHAGQENIILFPTLDEATASRLLPGLSAWAERYRVTVVGFPEWLKFTAIDEETLFKLNTVLFQPSHARREDPRVAAFAEKYRTFFHAEPSLMAYKAFDIAFFFVRHAAAHGERALEALTGSDATGDFTRFKFAPLPGMPGLENRGFFLINYTPAYEIKVNALN